jgi:hypothetical protein
MENTHPKTNITKSTHLKLLSKGKVKKRPSKLLEHSKLVLKDFVRFKAVFAIVTG